MNTMKKDNPRFYVKFKLFQLILHIVFFIGFFIYLKVDPILSSSIFTNSKLLSVCIFLWIYMIISFVILLIDFKQLELFSMHDEDLNRIAYKDTLTGMPNRASCDLLFKKYDELKDTSSIGISLISITNLEVINEAMGRGRGDYLIQDFAILFEEVGKKYGFVGRNGGNEFLIVIEDCTDERMQEFLNKFELVVKYYNNNSDQMPVTYKADFVIGSDYDHLAFSGLVKQLYRSRK